MVTVNPNVCRTTVSVSVVLAVAMAHVLRIGSHLHGTAYRLYYAYASDVLIPIAAYFLLCMNEPAIPWLRSRKVKAIAVLTVASTAEILQGCGIPALGVTFDPIDFVMYGAGVAIAMILDRFALSILCASRRAPAGVGSGPDP